MDSLCITSQSTKLSMQIQELPMDLQNIILLFQGFYRDRTGRLCCRIGNKAIQQLGEIFKPIYPIFHLGLRKYVSRSEVINPLSVLYSFLFPSYYYMQYYRVVQYENDDGVVVWTMQFFDYRFQYIPQKEIRYIFR